MSKRKKFMQIISLIIVFSVVLTYLTAVYADNEMAFTENILFYGDFNDDGDKIISNDWVTVNNGKMKIHPGAFETAITTKSEDDYMLKISNKLPDVTGGWNLQMEFSPNITVLDKLISIEGDFMLPEVNKNTNTAFFRCDMTGRDEDFINLLHSDNGSFALEVGGKRINISESFEYGEWYHIKLYIDSFLDKIYLYAETPDNQYSLKNVDCSSLRENTQYIIRRFLIYSYGDKALGTEVYCDNLKVTEILNDSSNILSGVRSEMRDGVCNEALLREAVLHLSKMEKSDFRDMNYNEIKAYAEEHGCGDVCAAKCQYTEPEDNSKVYIENIKKIILNYNYTLSDIGIVSVRDENNETIECNAALENNIIKLDVPKAALKPDTKYNVSVTDVKDFAGEYAEDKTFTFRTGFVPECNVENGKSYSQGTGIEWSDYSGIKTAAKLRYEGQDAADYEMRTPIEQTGNYELELISENQIGEKDSKTVNFNINEAMAPEARNPVIKPCTVVETGADIEAYFEFYDGNNDKIDEEGTKYSWYRSDSENGTFEKINDADKKIYTLTDEDEGKYIKFEVIPKAKSIRKETGEMASSVSILAQCAPNASTPILKNTTVDGKTVLKTEFVYSDKNGDDIQGESIYKWKVKDGDGNVTELSDKTDSLIMDESFNNKMIAVFVTPVSKMKPYYGNEVQSEWFVAAAEPIAKNVKVESVKTGTNNYLVGGYTYFDPNGDEEGGTTFKWIDVNTDKTLSAEKSIKLTTGMNGKKLVFEVTPRSVAEPQEGKSVRSEEYTVRISESGSSYGGSSGGGGGSIIYKAPEKEPDIEKDEDVQCNFKDIINHWANKEILFLYKKGFVNGVSNVEFQPDRTITRAEFVAMVLKSLKTEPKKYRNGFADVNGNSWHADYIQSALDMGVIDEGINFRPSDNITRAEAAKILCILAPEFNLSKVTHIDFNDIDSMSDDMKNYVVGTSEYGIFVGDENKNFRPDSAMTRAETAAVLYRILIKII